MELISMKGMLLRIPRAKARTRLEYSTQLERVPAGCRGFCSRDSAFAASVGRQRDEVGLGKGFFSPSSTVPSTPPAAFIAHQDFHAPLFRLVISADSTTSLTANKDLLVKPILRTGPGRREQPGKLCGRLYIEFEGAILTTSAETRAISVAF